MENKKAPMGKAMQGDREWPNYKSQAYVPLAKYWEPAAPGYAVLAPVMKDGMLVDVQLKEIHYWSWMTVVGWGPGGLGILKVDPVPVLHGGGDASDFRIEGNVHLLAPTGQVAELGSGTEWPSLEAFKCAHGLPEGSL